MADKILQAIVLIALKMTVSAPRCLSEYIAKNFSSLSLPGNEKSLYQFALGADPNSRTY
jgi:hypothetical protein